MHSTDALDRSHAARPRTLTLISAVVVAALAAAVVTAQSPGPGQAWADKVDAAVTETLAAGGEAEFLVVLTAQADLSAAATLPTKQARGAFVAAELKALAERTQAPLVAELKVMGATYTARWVRNMILVTGGAAVVEAMARRPDVARIAANFRIAFPLPAPVAAGVGGGAAQAVEWNISRINAPQAWAEGYRGQGVVVGGQDTGYQWDHPALKNQYRGWNGSAADHNYNWHDAFAASGGNPLVPFDDYGHGTHTMGTVLGNDLAPTDPGWPAAAGNAIGVAPAARWIGCRNMKAGVGSVASYTDCYQWFIAPTDVNGQNPNPALAPDIINNSWSCTLSEGCTDASVLHAVVQNVRAAGILTVHSAGNTGSACSSMASPPAIYAESFAVGSTDTADAISSSSARGPVTVDGSNRQKPDVSAPGVGIRSAYTNNGYTSMSGTSMAAPHVAGAAALILSARPTLGGNVAALEQELRQSAVHLTTTQGCGGDSPTAVPNNVYGWGRVNAYAAVHRALDAPWFTDDPLVPRTTTVKATHVIELRARIDELRARYALGGFAWTDPSLTPRTTTVRADHVAELRTALAAAYSAAGRTPPAYSGPALVPRATVMSAAHVAELRAAVLALW